jgi:dTDP-glucose pyrophosphorylase
MDCVIFCAGRGTRLRPHTDMVPKPLLPLSNHKCSLQQLIDFAICIKALKIILVVGYRKQNIAQFVAENYPDHRNIIQFVEQPEPLGTGDAFRKATDHVTSDRFLVINGDDVYSENLLMDFAEKCLVGTATSAVHIPLGTQQSVYTPSGGTATSAVHIPLGTPAGGVHIPLGTNCIASFKVPDVRGFGEIRQASSQIQIVEKPSEPHEGYVNIGLYCFIFDDFCKTFSFTQSARGEYEITEYLNALIERRNLRVIDMTPADQIFWFPVNTLEEYQRVNDFFLTKEE